MTKWQKPTVMTKREIDKGLNKIYRERSSWSAINKQFNYNITENEIRRKEFILFAQYILYRIEDAKKRKTK